MHENWDLTPILHFVCYDISYSPYTEGFPRKNTYILVHSVNVPVWVWGLIQHFHSYAWKILTLRWERGTGGYSVVEWTGQLERPYPPNLLSLPLCSHVSNTSNKYRTEVSRGSVWPKITVLGSFCRQHSTEARGCMVFDWQCQRQSELIEFWCINTGDKNILYTSCAVTHSVLIHRDKKKKGRVFSFW